MDWESEALMEALWTPMLSVSGLCIWFSTPREAIDTFASLSRVNWTFLRRSLSLWYQMDRPYVRELNWQYAQQLGVCDLSLRRFVHRLKESLACVEVHDVVITGGYAAWQLERRLETLRGKDAFPRVRRVTNVFLPGTDGGTLWLPSNMDVYVACDDMSLVLELIRDAYQRYIVEVFDDTHHVACDVSYVQRKEEIPLDLRRDYLLRLAHTWGLPARLCIDCGASFDRRPDSVQLAPPEVHGVLQLHCIRHQPLFPLTLKVLCTSRPQEGVPYAPWISDHMDLEHCGVVMDLACTGEWVFEGRRSSALALMHRRLVLRPSDFATAQTCIRTVRRLRKYTYVGFTADGDTHWTSADEEEAMIFRAFAAWE